MKLTEITIDSSKMNTQERADKLAVVSVEMHTVLNSTIFRDNVMRMITHGERSQYKELENSAVYKMLKEGSELMTPGKDYHWQILVDDYFSIKNVIGYTKRGLKTIFVNTKFFDSRPTVLVASNIVHEFSHLLGFSHDFKSTADRPFSVSYQLNKAYEKSFSKIYNIYPSTVTRFKRNWKTLFITSKSYTVEVWPEY